MITHAGSRKFLVASGRAWVAKSEAVVESPLLLWLMFGFGIAVRCVQYLANRSLWLDESMLALNIVHKTPLQLLQPLDYEQGAPLGFLILEKTIVQMLGNNEYALRLLPLISGAFSLFIFYSLAKIVLEQKALLISLALFIFSGPLIYYASEVKQYSSDVAIAVLMYFLTIRYIIRNGFDVRNAIVFGIIGSVAIWISHPALFILIGVGTVLIWLYIRRKTWGDLRRLVIACAFLVLNFTVLYFISLRHLAQNDVLLDYWTASFMPLAPLSLREVRWFIDTFFSVFEYPLGLAFAGLGSLSFLAGCRAFWRSRKAEFLLFVLPILFALLASSLQKYPFSGRFLLFTVPSMFILIAQGADEIRKILQSRDVAVARMFVALLLLHPGLFAGYYFIKPYKREEIKPVINYIREYYHSGDVLYLYPEAFYAFKYYQERYGLTDVAYVVGHHLNEWKNHLDDVTKLCGHHRVWILFSHMSIAERLKEEEVILNQLDSMGTRLATLKQERASVYLYDLEGSTPPLQLIH